MNVKDDPTRMHGLFSEILGMIADELTPVRVFGSGVKVMYNRNDAGWIVTLMNQRNPTIAFPGFRPAMRDRDTAGVVLEPRFETGTATEWLTGESLTGESLTGESLTGESLTGESLTGESLTGESLTVRNGQVSLLVPSGEIRIIEFREK